MMMKTPMTKMLKLVIANGSDGEGDCNHGRMHLNTESNSFGLVIFKAEIDRGCVADRSQRPGRKEPSLPRYMESMIPRKKG